MKINVSEATGPALDWLVAKCEEPIGGYKAWVQADLDKGIVPAGCNYSTNWAQGGPIIEQHGIGILFDGGSACRKPQWFATPGDQSTQTGYEGEYFDPTFMVAESIGQYGPTPLIAAMRCFVASKLGNEVEVPDELA